MITLIIVAFCIVFVIVLFALVYAEEQLAKTHKETESREQTKFPDLETIRQVMEAYDRLRVMHGDGINKFIDRAIAVRNEMMRSKCEMNRKTNKK